MAYFNYNNQRIFYRIKGTGQPVLLIHGNSVSSRMFSSVMKLYSKNHKVITFDFPGHGKSGRLKRFDTDFWFYNAKVVNALLEELNLENVVVIGTSGGALVGINLALEHPEKVRFLIADSFEGEYPLESYIKTIREDRENDKKKWLAKYYWWYFHGRDWKKVVDLDTNVNIEFAETGKSFFHKPVSELNIPTLLTGSLEDEYCHHLHKIYANLKKKSSNLDIHLFEKGKHPAMISNKTGFYELFCNHLKKHA